MRSRFFQASMLSLGALALVHCSSSKSEATADEDAAPPSDAASVDGSAPVATDSGGATDAAIDATIDATADPGAGATTAVLTYRNDNFRTGASIHEHLLDVSSVRARGMRVKFTNPVEGEMNTQPLYVPKLSIGGADHDAVFVTTLENHVYAFDANAPSATETGAGEKLWDVTLVDPESPTTRNLARGIYGTPVIDLATFTMYLVFSTRNTVNDHGKLTPAQTDALDIAFFLVALDIRDGKQLRIQKIEGSYPKKDGSRVAFEARNHWCRPALLMSQGSLFIGCGMRSHELTTLFHGWLFRYEAQTFQRQGVFCTSPAIDVPNEGASLWQSGAGPAEDADGNVYVMTGNGKADFANGTYGDAMIQFSTAGESLTFKAAFTTDGPEGKLYENDVDYGSGGPLVIPETGQIVGGGKTGTFYSFESQSLSLVEKFQSGVNQYDPTGPIDADWEGGPHLHGTPAYWRSSEADYAYVYSWAEQDYLRAHRYNVKTARFDPGPERRNNLYGPKMTMPGGMLSISANGTQASTAIVWATLPEFEDPDNNPGGRLLAYDAETLEQIWETTFPSLPKWMPPTIADGKVFVGTSSGSFVEYELAP